MRTIPSIARALGICALAAGAACWAGDWPQWRGPRRDGICRETGWATQWPEGGPPKLWQAQVGKGLATVAIANGRVYTLGMLDKQDKQGKRLKREVLWCLDAATGELKWSQSGLGKGNVLLAAGKLIVLSQQGELLVAPASPDGFKPISRAKILSGLCWTMPVLANGRLYCRNHPGTLRCLDLRRKP